ncbi:MAG: hypothetical protein LAP38_10730 [Acidobacteriia bacterium]|nr:hypothetical protein [Terriglobia bacterium]
MQVATLTVDPHYLAGIAVAAAFSGVLLLIPFFRQTWYACTLSIIAAGVYYGREFPGFVLVSAAAYAVMRGLCGATSPEQRWRWACVAMLVLAGVFTLARVEQWERYWSVAGLGPIVLLSLGMWPTLKLMTLFWEVGSGSLPAPTLLTYVLWICLPFTLSGPVLRFSQMPGTLVIDWRTLASAGWWFEAAAATAKLMVGVSLNFGQQLLRTHFPQAHYFDNAISAFVTGPIGFYLTTAGYFHWMELLARPAGVKIPPSFNFPVGRENISAFWMNWNMTATYVFRDYLFYNRWGRRTYNIYFNTILLFTLVGLWHAANAYWVLWGFLHGLLFTIFLLWRKYRGALPRLPLAGTRLANMGARVLTYFSVCMCWYLPSKILQKLAVL